MDDFLTFKTPCEEIGKEAEVKVEFLFLKQDFCSLSIVAATVQLVDHGDLFCMNASAKYLGMVNTAYNAALSSSLAAMH